MKLIILLPILALIPLSVFGAITPTYWATQGNTPVEILSIYKWMQPEDAQEVRCQSYAGLGGKTIHSIQGTTSYYLEDVDPNGEQVHTYSYKISLSPVDLNSANRQDPCSDSNGPVAKSWINQNTIKFQHGMWYIEGNGVGSWDIDYRDIEIYVPDGYYVTVWFVSGGYSGCMDIYANLIMYVS